MADSGGSDRRPVVLIVDDDQLTRRMLALVLAPDYGVATATCGADAVSGIAQGARYDVVLCDLHMLGLDGRAVRDRVGQIAPDQARRFVFVTADTGAPPDVCPVLLKPFDTDALLAVVAQCVTAFGRVEAP